MIDKPQIVQTAQMTGVIRLTIPQDEIQNAMGPGISLLMAAVAAQGMAPTGAWFTHHFRMDAATWDFEIGVPVSLPVTPVGRVAPGELQAARVARTVYHGPYEGLGNAWGESGTWIASEGHKEAADLWEGCLSGPESGSDPSAYKTELNRPLIS